MTADILFWQLAHRPGDVTRVAQWWHDEWGLPDRHSTLADYVLELAAVIPDELPMHVVAAVQGRTVGVATLKVRRDHPVIPSESHWLSGVYIDSVHRRRGIATALCGEIWRIATARRSERLYLQTDHLDGGLYARLGWSPVQQYRSGTVDLLVMLKELG
jgi:GNAT superfamily N-acetyltransferase